MKTFFIHLLVLLIPVLPLMAQVNNPASLTSTFKQRNIQVSDKSTTVIVFPFTVLDADRGSKELDAEKINSVGNVLKVKAASDKLDTTSLHVFTADGNIYDFTVTYISRPAITTYNLTEKNGVVESAPLILSGVLNEDELKKSVEQTKTETPFIHRSRRRYNLKLSLRGIYSHGELLFLKFDMKNKSNLSFEAGFAGIYINDKKTAKRTSVQQIIITPVYADPLPCIADSTGMQWVIAIPKTTIPDKKQMSLEVLEKNGGRHINIIIRNKDLFKAKAI